MKDCTINKSIWHGCAKQAAGIVALSSLIATSTVMADSGVIYFDAPISPKPLYDRLEIQSDGTQYTGTADGVGRIDTDIRLRLDAGAIGRVKSWRAWIQYATAKKITKGWSNLPEQLQESYPLGSRPNTVEGTFGLPVSFSSHGANYCNLIASSLRRQGLSNAEIFAVDRQVQLALRPALTYEMSGTTNINEIPVEVAAPDTVNWGHLDLHCLATVEPVSDEGPTRDPLATIAYANLALAFDEQPDECPTQVIAQALFTSPTKGRFTVRLRDAYGHASKLVELKMDAADKVGSHYVKVWNQGFTVAAADDNTGGKTPPTNGSDEFVIEQNAEPPINPNPRPGAGAPDQLSDHEGHPNEYVNSVWVEIVDAGLGSEPETDHEEYRIMCPSVVIPTDRPGDKLDPTQIPVQESGIKYAQSWSR